MKLNSISYYGVTITKTVHAAPVIAQPPVKVRTPEDIIKEEEDVMFHSGAI